MRIFALALLLVCPATVYPADTCVARADEEVHTGPEEEVWSAWTLDLEEDETAARSEELEKWQAEWETWKAEIEAREAETRPHMDRYKTVMGEAKADRARMLAKRGDVRSLLAAAVLMQQNASGDALWNQEALGYLDAAQRRGGSEPLVWWLTAIMCHADSPVCDRPAARATLAALDPDNAAVWNLLLADAEEREDEAAAESHLQRMFHSGRHDDYYGTLRPLIYDAYRDVRTPPSARDGLAKAGEAYGYDYTSLALESIALLEGVNLLATIAVQNHAGMASACREEALEAVPGRRADCRAYFERVAEGSEHFMGKKTAYSKLADLAESDAAKQPWLDATRKLDWLIAQHAELSNSPENLTRYLERMFQEGEIAAAEHALRANDIPIEPPADWDASSYWQKYMEEAGIDLPTEATGEVSDRMD